MCKKIPLSQGKHALVDDDWFERLDQHNWSFNNGYACRNKARNKGSNRWVGMHRVITGAKRGEQVDHINGDTLDNRSVNLRVVTHVENVMNRPGFGGTSKYKGVYHDRRRDRWYARCSLQHIGSYKSEIEAAKAYDEYVSDKYGDCAWLNFPDSEQFDRELYEQACATADVISYSPRPPKSTEATNYRAKRVTVVCDGCGKCFERKQHYAERYSHNFCTRECWIANFSKHRAEQRNDAGQFVKNPGRGSNPELGLRGTS